MEQLQFAELVVDQDNKLCSIKGNPIKLTKTEYNLVVFFLSNKNKIFTREELIEKGWSEPVNNRAVDVAITRLRKKLGDYGKHIVTRLGFGYGFNETL